MSQIKKQHLLASGVLLSNMFPFSHNTGNFQLCSCGMRISTFASETVEDAKLLFCFNELETFKQNVNHLSATGLSCFTGEPHGYHIQTRKRHVSLGVYGWFAVL